MLIFINNFSIMFPCHSYSITIFFCKLNYYTAGNNESHKAKTTRCTKCDKEIIDPTFPDNESVSAVPSYIYTSKLGARSEVVTSTFVKQLHFFAQKNVVTVYNLLPYTLSTLNRMKTFKRIVTIGKR